MVRLGGARLRALVPFCTSLLTLLVLPPLFSSKLVGLFLNQKESVMTNLFNLYLLHRSYLSPVKSIILFNSSLLRYGLVP